MAPHGLHISSAGPILELQRLKHLAGRRLLLSRLGRQLEEADRTSNQAQEAFDVMRGRSKAQETGKPGFAATTGRAVEVDAS